MISPTPAVRVQPRLCFALGTVVVMLFGIPPAAATTTGELPFNAALERFEADLLRGLLKKHAGNIDAAAREAGMNMVTIYRKIKRYGLKKEEYL